MIKVLVLDDRFISRISICDLLSDALYNKTEITACRDLYEADYAIENNTFDVLIVDSMMSTLGLAPEQIDYAKGGVLTGLIWLGGLYKNEKLGNPLIYIFTGFCEAFDDYMSTLNKYIGDDNSFTKSIKLVPKDKIEIIIQDIKEKYNIK